MMKLLAKLAAAIILPVTAFIIGASIYDRLASTSSIEYRVTNVGPLLYRPLGLENRVRVDFDGKPYKNVSMMRLELFNRSTKSLSDVPIRIHLENGTATLLGKMLMYPTEQDSEHFAWDKTDNTSLDFTARGLNTTWTGQPVVTIHLFFDEGKLPDLMPSTPKAGIVFVPFNDAKFILFPYDLFVFVFILLGLAAVGIHHISQIKIRNQSAAFMRIFAHLYANEVNNAKEIQVTTAKEISGTRLLTIAALTYTATNQRFLLAQSSDWRTYKTIGALMDAASKAEAEKKAETVQTPA
jgi:hypothetical protein